jgi:glutamine cyclotransferase
MVRRGLGLVTLISILVIVSLFIAASVSGQDVTTQNATVVDRVELPDEIKETTLLAWNKEYIWQIGETDYNVTVNKIRPSDGKIVHRINLPDSVIGPEGLVVSNDSLWLLNNANAGQQREVYKIDLSTGKVDRTIPVAVARSEGLAYDGEYFWTHNSDSEKFVKIDPETGESVE